MVRGGWYSRCWSTGKVVRIALAVALPVLSADCAAPRPPASAPARPAASAPAPETSAVAAAHVKSHDRSNLAHLAFLFGVDVPSAVGASTDEAGLEARVAGYRAFVKGSISDPRLHRTLTPKFLSFFINGGSAGVKLAPFELKSARAEDGTEYFFRKAPCAKSSRLAVKPWWRTKDTVRVCEDSLSYDVTKDPGTQGFCEAQGAVTGASPCGCGPHLFNCARARDVAPLRAATADEIVSTFGEVVANRRASELLTMSETVRSTYAQFFYQRSHFYRTGELLPLDVDVDDGRKVRPRDPEFGGGILSAPMTLYYNNSRRPIVADLYADLLCAPLNAIAIDAHTLLRVSSTDLRRNTNERLLSTPGCQNCHVRLEWGMEALGGFPDGTLGIRYEPSIHKPKPNMKVFVLDHNDQRAEGPATPAFWGQALVAQPEFWGCMERKMESFVYGGYPVPAPIHAFLEQQFRTHGSLATLLEDAVVLRMVGAEALPLLSARSRTSGSPP